MAFEIATDLCRPGPLDGALWDKGLAILGRSGAMAVVQYVGFYKYVCTILNGFDAKVPKGADVF